MLVDCALYWTQVRGFTKIPAATVIAVAMFAASAMRLRAIITAAACFDATQ